MSTNRVLVMTADQFEDTELLCPVNRLLEEGFAVDIATPGKKQVKGKKGYQVDADLSVGDLSEDAVNNYDLLLLPGGKAPAKLREMSKALMIAKGFDSADKPIAAICHGPQILISAGLLQGKKATCYSQVAPELKEAGAHYEDKEVVVDGKYVFSRHPGDIPFFNKEIIKQLHNNPHVSFANTSK